MNISLRQLRALVSVIRTGSFTRSAAELGQTQSAASLSIRQLETELGVRLFDRDTRNVHPTPLGRELGATLERLLADLDAVLARVQDAAAHQRGVVRIAVVPSVASRLMPRCIADCRRRYPEIEVQIEEVSAREVAAVVQFGKADFGVVNETNESMALAQTHLSYDTFCLICRHDDPLAKKQAPTWQDLAGRDMIMLDAHTGSRGLIDDAIAAAGISVKIVQQVSRPETAAGMIAAGLGIAVLPELSAPDPEHPVLQTRMMAGREVRRRMVLIHAAERPLNDAATAVEQSLLRMFGDGETKNPSSV